MSWLDHLQTEDCLIAVQAAARMAQNFGEDVLILQNLRVVRASEWDGPYLERIRYHDGVDYRKVLK